jgi:hypothetical protein
MGRKSKGLSMKATIALMLTVLIFGIGATMLYYAFYKVAYMQIYDIEVETSEGLIIGFNADPNLHFGKIPAVGGRARKEINVHNDWDIPLLVRINIKGEAAQFISVEDNNFLLQPNETRHVNAFATIPANYEKIEKYTGEAKIIFLRP